jgi:predicted acylesterase/phospholipase RssA
MTPRHSRTTYAIVAVLAALALLAGLIIKAFVSDLWIHDVFVPPSGYDAKPSPYPAPQPVPMTGLALSGGGARAAVFAAAGMEELAARSLLKDVTHVSSVSGGGFPASYLATHPEIATCSDAACRTRYFGAMQEVVQRNYLYQTEWRQFVFLGRAFTPSRRVMSTQSALDHPDFLSGATFDALAEVDRKFYFNAVSYDTGRRFLFTNDTLPHPVNATASLLPPPLRSSSYSTTDATVSTPGTVPLSLAVVTSAAFPPFLGQITIHKKTGVKETDTFWHLGDGGVVENTGVETLREIAMARGTPKPGGVIYSFNAGLRLNKKLSNSTHDFSFWSRDVTRLVDVIQEYGFEQRQAFNEKLNAEHGIDITLHNFDYLTIQARLADIEAANAKLDAGTPKDPRAEEWALWPSECPKGKRLADTPAAHLREVPTALYITRCNAVMMRRAAAFLVADALGPRPEY